MLGHRPIRQLFEIIVEVHLHRAVRKKCTSLVPQSVKNLPAIQETRVGKIPGGGHGNLLHYSCLESPQEQRKKYREVLYTLYSAFPQNSILPKYNIIS